MNPVPIHCTQCQQAFLVRPEDLKAGTMKFKCTRCEAIFSFEWTPPQVTETPKVVVSAPGLEEKWKMILDNFENNQIHDDFIGLCLKRNNLGFASEKYKELLAQRPNDPIIKKMQERIISLAGFTYLATSSQDEKPKPKWVSFSGLAMALATSLVILGALSSYRYLISVGGAILVFVIGIRFLGKNNP